MNLTPSQPYNDLPPLPPDSEIETIQVLRRTVAAARALAALNGRISSLPNPSVLLNGILLREARLSSEIENIVTTSDALYRAAAGGPENSIDPQTKEVLRYREALWHGCQQLAFRPLSTNLFVDIVSRITGVQMEIRRVPGTTLKNQQGNVIYTPPVGEELLRRKLGNLENYLHADTGPDSLIRMAVMHYQFEAIHPFTDGNGRTGRILNILYLVERKLLDSPVLYLSQYILQHRSEYYSGLRAVTERQEWEPWVAFMLRAIEETALQTLVKVDQILDLIDSTARKVKAEMPKIYSKDLIETIFRNPYTRIADLESARIASRVTATRYLRALSGAGVLSTVSMGRELYFLNDALLALLSRS